MQGCEVPSKASVADAAKLGELLDAAPRVHDVELAGPDAVVKPGGKEGQPLEASAHAGHVPGETHHRHLLHLLKQHGHNSEHHMHERDGQRPRLLLQALLYRGRGDDSGDGKLGRVGREGTSGHGGSIVVGSAGNEMLGHQHRRALHYRRALRSHVLGQREGAVAGAQRQRQRPRHAHSDA